MQKTLEKLEKLRFFVGNTPLVKLTGTFGGQNLSVYAKYEAWNFTGSIKDRMALCILENAYKLGKINEGDIILEATSGNTGIAFAAMGAFLGHPVHIYMPDWLSEERKQLLRFYGATLHEISAEEGGFLKCIEIVKQKSQKNGYFCPKQFDTSWNPLAHMKNTGPEIEKTLNDAGVGDLDIFITGAGTGGTIMGIYHHFIQNNKNFEAFPVFPDKNEDGGHRIEGIGDSFVPEILDLDSLGPVFRVNDSDAINVARQINKLGLSVGISSGANVFAAFSKAALDSSKLVGTILCDDNKKYLSTDLVKDTEENLSQEIKITDFQIII